MMNKICAYCGKEFQTESRVKKYCSKDCQVKKNNRKRKPHDKKCLYCGQIFTPDRQRALYCSTACRITADRERKKARQITDESKRHWKYPPKCCTVCGKEFTPNSGNAQYCSMECAAIPVKSSKPTKTPAPTATAEEFDPSKRFYKMSLRAVSAECARLHLSYGEAQVMAKNGTLPDDFGKEI